MGTHPIFESDFDCLTEKCFGDVQKSTSMEIMVKQSANSSPAPEFKIIRDANEMGRSSFHSSRRTSLLYSQSLRLDKFLDEHNVDDTFGSDIKQVPEGMPRLTTSISKSSSFRKLSDTI